MSIGSCLKWYLLFFLVCRIIVLLLIGSLSILGILDFYLLNYKGLVFLKL